MNFKPQTGDKFHFSSTGNTARLGAPTEDGFEARYIDGPSKGMQVVLSERFLAVAGYVV